MTDKPEKGIQEMTAAGGSLTPTMVLTDLLGAIQALHAATELREGLEVVADALHRYVVFNRIICHCSPLFNKPQGARLFPPPEAQKLSLTKQLNASHFRLLASYTKQNVCTVLA